MATLEKIRSKSVLLLVIIGVALLAFIIGDFFTSGRTFFGTGTTVAKVGDQKIDIQDFQRRMEAANQQVQQSGQKVDQAMLQQQVLGSMVSEKLFAEEMNKLGIRVTDEELTDAMLGSGSAYLDAMLQQQGIPSAREFHNMIMNPATYGLDAQTASQFAAYWQQLENQMENNLLQQKFNTLFTGTLTANELDAKALYDENNATAHVAYAVKDFASVSDDEYPVSDADIQAQYAKNKKNYELTTPQRSINYISVEIAPSAEDIVAAEQKVEEALAALNSQPGTEGLADMPEFVVNRNRRTAEQINDNRIKSFVDTAKTGSASLVARIGNDFTLAKLIGKTSEPDSISVNVFGIAADRAKTDSVIAELNAGRLSFDSLAAVGGQGMQKDLKISMLDQGLAPLRDALVSHSAGSYFIPDTNSVGNYTVVRINSRDAAVPVFDIAEIAFTAEPSRATVNRLEADLQAFVKANEVADSFIANAPAAGYQVFPSVVTEGTPMIDNLPATRNAVHWAMNAKKGQVSPVLGEETDGRFLALALSDIYTDYIPASEPNVKSYLESLARNEKKAAALMESYKGKANDLAGYAEVMGTKVDTTTVNFGQLSAYNAGINGPELAARIALAQPGALVGPVQGTNGVAVFSVINVDTEGRPYSFDESAITFNRTRGAAALRNNIELMRLGNRKIQNNLLKFFQQ